MKKRIFGFMSLNILLTSVMLSVIVGFAAYSRFGEQMKESLKNERITIISESGEVLFDNYADHETLDNHLNRPEVFDAINNGYGESERYSDTMLEKTYYYAMKLTDNNILRLSFTSASIYSMIYKFIPALIISILFVLLISFMAARSLTNRVLAPIKNVNLSGPEIDTYDELSPFIKEIVHQKQKINQQILAIENRANTINAITGSMREGLILTDKDGMIISANLSAAEIFRETDMVDKNILEICRYVDLLHKMRECLSGKNAEMIFEKDSKTYNIYLNPVYNAKIITGAVILFLDITEKLKAEKQRREFSANVSHELKTPLTTISALSEMIENGMAKDNDVKDFITKISGQAKRLINMVDDIIKLSEFDEGNIVREYNMFDLHALTESVMVSMQNKAQEKNVTVNITGETMQITANERMIDELLFNLIDNGIKYNKDGGNVTVNLNADGENCIISVSDTGIGIPPEHIEHIFERFYRVDKSRSKKTGGTGLGLSIVKHIVEHHNGRIEIESKENVGTTISCYIRMK